MLKRTYRVFAAVTVLCIVSMAAHAQWTWTPQTGRFVNIKKLPKETPELQIEHARSLLLQGDLKQAQHETEKFSEFYKDSELGDQNQFLRGEIRMAQEKWVDAAKEFQKVVTKYPNSALYNQVIKKQYEIGDKLYEEGQARLHKRFTLHRKKPLKTAIEVYGMVIKNQPFTDAAAEAQYKIGLCHHTRKEYTEAAFEYRRVIEDYSTSDWVANACYGLAKCYYDSAHPPAYDQRPSKLAIDAMDDFKQRFPSDARVKELEGLRTEMRSRIALQRLETAQLYAKRRDFTAARLYCEVVTKQFAETPSAGKAQKWLDENPVKEVRASDRALRAKQKTS
jgi:outer membrane protein assembly factor BamD